MKRDFRNSSRTLPGSCSYPNSSNGLGSVICHRFWCSLQSKIWTPSDSCRWKQMHINILDSDPEDIDSSDRQRPWGCDRTRPNEGQKTRHRGLPLSFHKQQHTYIYLSNYFLYLTRTKRKPKDTLSRSSVELSQAATHIHLSFKLFLVLNQYYWR